MKTEEQSSPSKSRGDTLGFTVRVIGELHKATKMPVPDLVKLADVLREECKSSDPLDWTVAELIAAIDIVENPGDDQ